MTDYFEKTVRDNYGDPATVDASAGDNGVGLSVEETDRRAYLAMTPKKARRLAKALRKAAKVAEGKA